VEKITKDIATFVGQYQGDTFCNLVLKLSGMIGGLGSGSLSFACKLTQSFLQIGCKKSDIP
jgi:hypothetical protein